MSQQTASQALADLFGMAIRATADMLVETIALQPPQCLQMYEEAVKLIRVVHLQSVEDSEEKMFEALERLIDRNGLSGTTRYFQLVDGRIALVIHDIGPDDTYVVWPQAKNPTQINCVKYQGRYSYRKRHVMSVSPRVLESAFARFNPR